MSFGERFLELPDLFPARASGERWGGEEMTLNLAGERFRLEGLSRAQQRSVESRFARFPGAAGEDTLPVVSRLFRVPQSEFVDIDAPAGVYVPEFDHSAQQVRVAGWEFMARLDWRQGSLEGSLWTSHDGGGRFLQACENYLRILTAYRLVEAGGALLHSAGAVEGGGAFLFCGASGAGKSTLTRLNVECGRPVLSDDLNGVHPGGGGMIAEPVPFAGDLPPEQISFQPRPLRALFHLVKAPRPELRPLGRGESVGLLLSCSPFVNQDPFRSDRLLANLERIARSVPTHVLAFAREPGFWQLLEGLPE